jgi:hypothetical protein
MKKMIAAAVCAAALLGVSGTAFADDAMIKSDAMMKTDAMSKPAEMATLLCRPAMTGEKMTAMSASKTPLVCKTINMTDVMALKKKIEALPGGEPIFLKMFQEYHIGMNGVPQ